ncbi:MAG: prepilin-type N-terminal cleavage/methylation domain-containing protein [Planctomycetota bacterium]
MYRRFRKDSPKNDPGTVPLFAQRKWDCPLSEGRFPVGAAVVLPHLGWRQQCNCYPNGANTAGQASSGTRPRAGVTLLELLIALSIMVMVVGTLGGIATAVQTGFEYNQGHGAATQHARVALERITRTAREASANEAFPGLMVLADQVGSRRFPDTLVIWHPDGEPAAPEGSPQFNELVIYCPGPNDPGTLVEITTDDTAALSADQAVRASQIETVKNASTSHVTTLTDLLRTGAVDNAAEADLHGAVRFEVLVRPSDAQWADAGIPWEQLPWVQGIYGSKTGLRQAWVRIELQLMTGEPPAAGAVDHRQVIPFFGSAALQYTMDKGQR